ncbi:MAG: twin-arginine translocase TatA/TatE family subunit [Candidatus Krumholzibacteria bacterium]|jgi:sec-independent protein translocase protein TatA|nr:twin-arginine translocase TatA/TatE family subunit [Candidatus Krumholzibacteria bacterium]
MVLVAIVGGIGGWELFLVLALALLIFGPDKLPHLARKIAGLTIRMREVNRDFQREMYRSIDESGEEEAPRPRPETRSVERESGEDPGET